MAWLRWLIYFVIGLAVVAAGAYYWLFIDARVPAGNYSIDIAEVRKLADAIAGDKPTEIRAEKVFAFSFPHAAMVTGTGWEDMDAPSIRIRSPMRPRGRRRHRRHEPAARTTRRSMPAPTRACKQRC
jgi:hypothetical protein